MKKGIVTLGEALIDFIPMNAENTVYEKNAGGAPANVAVGAARLGAKSTFIGKIGDDLFGQYLYKVLKKNGVDVSAISFTKEYRTGLVFVTLNEAGDRDFSFYINESADQFLTVDDIDEKLFLDNKIFHFGTISLLHDKIKQATLKAIKLAKKHKAIISFDPNVRLSLFKDEELLRDIIFTMLKDVDLLKISEEELLFLSGSNDASVIQDWMKTYDLTLVFLTKGAEGSVVFTKEASAHVHTLKLNVEDTTGAGDAYVSGVLYCVDKRTKEIANMTIEEAVNITKFASVSGALTTAKKGAMTALPTLEEVQERLNITYF